MSDQRKWEVASNAENEGDLAVAARLYVRLALRRPRSAITENAQIRLGQMQAEARTKLGGLVDQILRPGTSNTLNPALRPVAWRETDSEKVAAVFRDLDRLARAYAGVDSIDVVINERIEKLRSDTHFAAILNEPLAAELFAMAQAYESNRHTCCAVLVYEQAAALSHAPTAKLAQSRLKHLRSDASVVASVQECRDLQACHAEFLKAKEIEAQSPGQAIRLYERIVAMTPTETPIHLAARERIVQLR